MINPEPSFFYDDPAVALRTPETPTANWTTGMNYGASNSHGIGINVGGGEVAGTPEQFTLNDQRGNPRTPQTGQLIGGLGYTDPSGWPSSGGVEGPLPDNTIRSGVTSANGDGSIATTSGNMHLPDLATGWTPVP